MFCLVQNQTESCQTAVVIMDCFIRCPCLDKLGDSDHCSKLDARIFSAEQKEQ